MKFTRYDRWGNQLGAIVPLDAQYEITTDGIDDLTLLTFEDIDKGDRVVWRDEDTGVWHEHEVVDSWRTHDSEGKPLTQVTCINSICELYGDDWTATSYEGAAASTVLAAVLGGTRWTFGGCDISGTYDFDLKDMSKREALTEIVRTLNAGEYQTTVTVGDTGVTGRYLFLLQAIGSSTVTHRFTYEKRLKSVKREVSSDEVYTAVRAIGAEIKDSDGIGTGTYYTVTVTDETARQTWGRPDGNGGKKHSYTRYADGNCDDLAFLRTQATNYLNNVKVPLVTYTCEVTNIGSCDIGDSVDVVDNGFSTAIRLRSRITRIKKDLLKGEREGTVTFGNRPNYMVKAFERVETTSEAAQDVQSSLEGVSSQFNDVNTAIKDINDWIAGGGGGSGTREFPVVDDASSPTVTLDDTEASGTKGVRLTAKASASATDIEMMRLYRGSSYGNYGSFRMDVGLTQRNLIDFQPIHTGGANLYIRHPSQLVTTEGNRAHIWFNNSTNGINIRGPLVSSNHRSSVSVFDGSAAIDVFGVGVEVEYDFIGIGFPGSYYLYFDRTNGLLKMYGAVSSELEMGSSHVQLKASSNTLRIDSTGVTVNGSPI